VNRPNVALQLLLSIAWLVLGRSVLALDSPPDVTLILEQMRQASGGARWDNIHALHLTGKAVSGGEDVVRDHWEDVETGRYLVRVTRPDSVAQVGFDGITLWNLGRSGIAYAFGDVDSALVAADEAYRVSRSWWFSDRRPATVALVGVRSENGSSFDILSITPEGGRAFEAWIDRSTRLLARTDEQQAEDRVVTTYSDYRAVEGVMLPFTIRTGDGVEPSFDEVEKIQSAEINPSIPDNFYALPSPPPFDVELPEGHTNVEVPFRLTADNRIMVPVTLNTTTVEAEFDSGGNLLLQPGTVSKLAIETAGRHQQRGGGEGSTTSKTGRVDTITLGGAKVRNLTFHSFAFHPDKPDEALVGLEILQRFVIRFDFDRLIMTLTDPRVFDYHGPGVIIPFHFQDNQPEVKGSIDGIAGLFAIDTGDNSSLLLIAPFARRYGLVNRYDADIPYSGKSIGATRGVWARKRVRTIALDGPDGRPAVEVHNPVTRISLQRAGFDANRNVSANIGLGILRQFNLTFDYPRHRIILEPNHFYGQPDIANRTGLRLKRDGAVWHITTIYPTGPAEEAELKVDDTIEQINGKSAENITEDELANELKGPVGSEVILQVRSSGSERRVSLVLRDVF
jgi:hypothetical protein